MKPHLRTELAHAIRAENFDVTKEGLYFPRQGVMAKGEYLDRVNRQGDWQVNPNLIVTEGFAHILSVALGPKAKPASYHLALFAGSTAPAANWTAANFAAVASEIVSQTEGYTSATRPMWMPPEAGTATGSIDNMAAAATLTIATSGSLNVTGAGMLTTNQRGGTTGALISASLYAAPRVFQNGDVYELAYRISLTS